MIKTGQAWAGLFVTLDATGAASAADSAPTGTLYVDGTANAAAVTVTGSNPYKWAVTLPTLTAGQRVDMYITATIDTIATAGIVASAQADTVLLSDGVTLADDAITASKFDESTAYPLKSADTGVTQVARVGADSDTLETLSDEIAAVKAETAAILVDTGTTLDGKLNTIDGIVDDILVDTSTTLDGKLNTIDTNVDSILADTGTDGVVVASGQTVATVTNLTNLPTMPADWVTASGLKADAVTEIQSGLALEATLTAIKAKTDNLPADPAQAGEYTAAIAAVQADLDNPDQYKADVSSLAKATDLQDVEDKIDVIATDTTTEIPATLATLATSAALATVDANVDSVLADTNEIQAELADGGRTDLLIDSIVDATTATGVLLKDAAIEAIFNDVVVTGTYTFAQLMKIMASALAGKLSGGGSTTLTFKSVDGASDVIVATVDANGNRTSVTLTV